MDGTPLPAARKLPRHGSREEQYSGGGRFWQATAIADG